MMSPINNNILTGKEAGRKPQEPPVKCPRCDSPNTKFCYYNNYSLTQPRHFCKTCRRYWTKGGALRNVPIGGGCRKNKKSKHSADSAPSALKFFQGISPAMDFQLGAPRFSNTHDIFNHFSSFANLSSAPCFNLESSGISSPVTGFGFPLSSQADRNCNGALGFQQEMGHSNLASSMESLSSINQDLHWKLQQQRLASLFAENNRKPILFQDLETGSFPARKVDGGNGNELLFNNCYAPPTSSGSNWSAWTELTHFTPLQP